MHAHSVEALDGVQEHARDARCEVKRFKNGQGKAGQDENRVSKTLAG